jgi:chaperonin GroES
MLELTYRGVPAEMSLQPNLAANMSEEDRNLIGQWCLHGFEEDKTSRAAWEARYARVLNTALQVMENKTYPWPNCSNVKFPLLTISAISFHSKAYPALVPAQGAVHCVPVGVDPPDSEIDRCARIGGHMSYQLQECTNWEAETDKGLIALPILGTVFKKTYYDPISRQRRSDLVLPQNLVVHYYTSSLDTCPRISEMFERTRQEVTDYELQGLWLEGTKSPPAPSIDALEAARNKAQGVNPPQPAPTPSLSLAFIEQQCMLDLDHDGYDEPYTVVIERVTGKVRRIITRYRPRDITYKSGSSGTVRRITAEQCYTKIPFIPSPDGGFYDVGFGSLIGPLNDSVDSLINQLIDGGTMATLGGGFLGRGVRIKKGTTAFTPFEWKVVDSTGDDLRKSIYPLDVREPSRVLLELLTFLVDFASRISSANEVQLGEALGQNAKSEVVQILNENGSRTFAAIFKRIHRATKEEFRKFYLLNRRNPIEGEYRRDGKWFKVSEQDYQAEDYGVMPVADPNIVTDSQKRAQAQLVFQTASTVPGHNIDAVVRRYYRAFGVTDIDTIFPGAGSKNATPPQPNPQMMKVQVDSQKLQLQYLELQSGMQEKRIRLQLDVQETYARITNLYAQAQEHAANAASEQDYAEVAKINAAINAAQVRQEGMLRSIEVLTDLLQLHKDNANDTGTGTSQGSNGGGAGVQPLAFGLGNAPGLGAAGGATGGDSGVVLQ